MDVKYIGRATRRIITEADMLRQGISGFPTTVWLKAGTEPVPDDGGAWLVEHIPTDFANVTPSASTPAPEATVTATASTRSSKTASEKN